MSEGPSLFCEWAVGSSINAAMKKLEKERLEREKEEAQQKRDVIRLELTADDESEVDSVRVTYPRSGSKRSSKRAAKSSSRAKQVRFEQGSLKPALKNKKSRKIRVYESSESDTFASETESGTDTTRSVDASTSEPSDSEAVSTDTSSSRRRKSHKSRRSKSESSGDSDAVYDSNCSDCEKDHAKKPKERKSRRKYASDPESSTGSERARHPKKDGKRRRSKERRPISRKDDPVDADSDSDTSNYGHKESSRGRERKEHRSKGDSQKERDHSSSRERKSALSTKQKAYPEAMPGLHPRRPNLIRPIRAEVMQVEHTVEGPEDPRPNAFVDERNNVVRVYHGPAYGNPFGKLYPRRNTSMEPLPVGVPHPLDNPYYHGFRNPQNPNHSHSPTGHMPTTLGGHYSAIPAHAPIPSGQNPEPHGHGTNNLTTGLWGIDSGPSNTTGDKASSWPNNVGPPQPSASLRQANPDSRWSFGGSNKGIRKDGGDRDGNDGWGNAGNGGDTGSWGTQGGDKTGDWGKVGGGDEQNEGNAGSSWEQGNDNATGGDDTWGPTNQGGDTRDNNENAGDFGDTQSPSQWNGQNNDMSWQNTGGDNWGGDNNNDNVGEAWGGNNNAATWDRGTDNASNNVGPPGNPSGHQNSSPSHNHVPGSWEGTPQGQFPSWGDRTAAQSTKNHQADDAWMHY